MAGLKKLPVLLALVASLQTVALADSAERASCSCPELENLEQVESDSKNDFEDAIRRAEAAAASCLDSLNETLRSNPQNVECLLTRALLLYRLNKPREAIAVLNTAITEEPELTALRLMRGQWLVVEGDLSLAVADFRQALGQIKSPKDRQEIEEEIALLERRIQAEKQSQRAGIKKRKNISADEFDHRWQLAIDFLESGRTQAALAELLYLLDHGDLKASYRGVMLSYIPKMLSQISKKLPEAREAMVERRTDIDSLIRKGAANEVDIRVWSALDRELTNYEHALKMLASIRDNSELTIQRKMIICRTWQELKERLQKQDVVEAKECIVGVASRMIAMSSIAPFSDEMRPAAQKIADSAVKLLRRAGEDEHAAELESSLDKLMDASTSAQPLPPGEARH